jgi:peptidoglycan/LPS O-acetylase OafA/YrhL
MASVGGPTVAEGPLTNESGTAPGDRRFRPDIEGLRAVAVLLVVLYHAGLGGLSGGYVGVDVFFVISGFVITGLLLRERTASGSTSLLKFYGRRSRRIIPAATVEIVVTVITTYVVLGVVYGNETAIDARWTAVFLANFHFASVGTNYLTAQQPPSALLNFWSLAVEEQFYLIYPTFFLLIAAVRTHWTLQAKLAAGLVAVTVASFTLSVLQTASAPTVAYFSPLTRAWELALGALVAVGTKWLLRIPRPIGAALTWGGLAAIAFGATQFNSQTAYPGSLVAIPVVGACFVIAGGTNTPRWATESLLGLPPVRWVGKLSYSIYLWHWPILIIAADAAGRSSLPFHQNVVWLLVALGAAVASFYLVEGPVRHASFGLSSRSLGFASIGLGMVMIAASLGVATYQLNANNGQVPASPSTATSRLPNALGFPTPVSSEAALLHEVKMASGITTLPTNLTPPLADIPADWGGPLGPCAPATGQTSVPACVFGDPQGTRTMVLYGDSHAAMWFYPIDLIAAGAHWKLVFLSKPWCPSNMLPIRNPPGFGKPDGEYAQCDQWHQFALKRIAQVHPDLVIVTQEVSVKPDGAYTADQWGSGMAKTLAQIPVPAGRIVVLGNIPTFPVSPPLCLSRHTTDVQACASPLSSDLAEYDAAEESAAAKVGARYLSVTPWFCSATCTAVVGRYEVYFDGYHITRAYAVYLTRVLSRALGFAGYN